MPGAMKHDYTHVPATKAQLLKIAGLLQKVEAGGGEWGLPDLVALAATLPAGTGIVGTGDFAGLIGWKITWTTTRSPRFYSPSLVAAVRLLTAPVGTVTFNHSPANEGDVKSKSRTYAQISHHGHNGSDHVALNRITMNAQAGEYVEGGKDYHDCSPRALRLHRGGRATATRQSAVYYARKAYEAASPDQRPFATWEEYEGHIDRAFRLLDQHVGRYHPSEETTQAA